MLGFTLALPVESRGQRPAPFTSQSRRGSPGRRQRVWPSARQLGSTAAVDVRILQRGDGWVAIDKPANLLVHRNETLAKGEKNFVVDELRALLPDTPPEDVRVVHRLDRPTSGVMLFAIGDTACASRLQACLQERTVTRKEYWAVARCLPGALPDDVHWINDKSLRNASKGKDSEPQVARTAFTRLLRLPCTVESVEAKVSDEEVAFEPHEIAVIRAELETGRRHQIRRHLANTKCPIVEDTTYGKGRHNRDARRRYGAQRLALHSRRLSFRLPSPDADDTVVTIEAPVPEDLRAVVRRVPGFDASVHEAQCDLGHILSMPQP
jgi:tRNA pseudouridine65 synthase